MTKNLGPERSIERPALVLQFKYPIALEVGEFEKAVDAKVQIGIKEQIITVLFLVEQIIISSKHRSRSHLPIPKGT